MLYKGYVLQDKGWSGLLSKKLDYYNRGVAEGPPGLWREAATLAREGATSHGHLPEYVENNTGRHPF